MTAVDVPPYVIDFLREHNILTLATASASGLPHAATVVYASDGLALYYCVSQGTLTARHIEENPLVAFAIDEYSPDWRELRGIQGHGESRVLLDPGQIRQAVTLFQEKFPFLAGGAASGELFFQHRAFYRVTPLRDPFCRQPAGRGPPGLAGVSPQPGLQRFPEPSAAAGRGAGCPAAEPARECGRRGGPAGGAGR